MYNTKQKFNLMGIFISHYFKKTEKIVFKDEVTSLSFNDLIENILYYHDFYEKQGLCKKYVTLSIEDSVEWIVAFLSLASIGAKIIPTSPNVSIHTLGYLEKTLPNLKKVNSLKDGLRPSSPSNLFNRPLIHEKLAINEENVVIHLTSGSTGEPKLTKRTYKSLIHEGINYKNTLQMNEKDHILNPLPLYHSFAFGFSLISSMVTGSKLTILNSYTPRKLITKIDSERPTIVPCVPLIADNLAKLFLSKKADVSSIRTLLIGAGKIKYKTRSLLLTKYGFHTSLNYGSTETGGIVTNTNGFPIKSVGKPMNGVSIKILDKVTRSEMDPLVKGEVWVKTPSMFKEYINESANLDKDGYYPMGDLGYVDVDGNLFLIGRKDKVIKIGGKNINLTYVEKKLFTIEGVSDCKVYVQTRPSNKYILKALVQSNENKRNSKTLIKESLLRELPTYMVPLISFVEKIPKNELGKKIVEPV